MVAKYNKGNYAIDESYRAIRTSVMIDKNIKTIVVTSAEMNEGKTTTISNLATCFSELVGKKILLIDCDFRKKSISKYFNIYNNVGLTEFISGEATLSDCIKRVGKLDVITSGRLPISTSTILESEYMKNLIKRLREEYDYIFIDAPPIARVNDACIISQYVDGVVVSASQEVNQNLVNMTKKRLEKVNANIIGVILNKFKVDDYKYYSYYGYYEEETKPKSRFSLFKKKIEKFYIKSSI